VVRSRAAGPSLRRRRLEAEGFLPPLGTLDGLACSRQQMSVPVWKLRSSRSRPWPSRARARQEGSGGPGSITPAAVHAPVSAFPSSSLSGKYVPSCLRRRRASRMSRPFFCAATARTVSLGIRPIGAPDRLDLGTRRAAFCGYTVSAWSTSRR
jgi:hypothetical protein